MYSTVKDILALAELQECHLLHQGVSCKQAVKSVTIMDNPNIINWLSGFEILLSNGSDLVNFQNREWKQFIAGLVKKNVAALFIKLAYFVDHLPEEIIEYSLELDFPVVVVPNSYSWTQISDPVQQYIIERQYYHVKEAIRLRDATDAIMIRGGTLGELCSTASEAINRPIAIFDRGDRWTLKASCGDNLWEDIDELLKAKKPQFANNLFPIGSRKHPIYQLESGAGKVLFLSLAEQARFKYMAISFAQANDEPHAADIYKIEQFLITLNLFIHKESELSRVEKHYYKSFLLDLIDGILTNKQEINKKAERLGRKVYGSYELMICECPPQLSPDQLVNNLVERVKALAPPVRDCLICERSEHLILFCPIIDNESAASLTALSRVISELLGDPSVQFGVSRCYQIDQLQTAYGEASFALTVRQFVGRQIIRYDDLGLLRLFEANSRKADTAFLSEFYLNTIQPLVSYDTANGAELTETLEALMKNELSVLQTAQSLYLHENTLRARIKRIEQITGRSLKAAIDIAELMIGIQIHRQAGHQLQQARKQK